MSMLDFWSLLVVALSNWFLRMISSAFIWKLIVAGMVYAFVFTILPLLVVMLVPSAIMNALSTYLQMLQTNQWSQGIAYVLAFFQFPALLQVAFPALAVRFLFRRI